MRLPVTRYGDRVYDRECHGREVKRAGIAQDEPRGDRRSPINEQDHVAAGAYPGNGRRGCDVDCGGSHFPVRGFVVGATEVSPDEV